jgi:hypothetical protein
MTDTQIRATIRQMLADWTNATDEQRAEALRSAAGLLDGAENLSKKWAAEAHEIDQDGDFCCAETRRNDAGELFNLLRGKIR